MPFLFFCNSKIIHAGPSCFLSPSQQQLSSQFLLTLSYIINSSNSSCCREEPTCRIKFVLFFPTLDAFIEDTRKEMGQKELKNMNLAYLNDRWYVTSCQLIWLILYVCCRPFFLDGFVEMISQNYFSIDIEHSFTVCVLFFISLFIFIYWLFIYIYYIYIYIFFLLIKWRKNNKKRKAFCQSLYLKHEDVQD